MREIIRASYNDQEYIHSWASTYLFIYLHLFNYLLTTIENMEDVIRRDSLELI